MNKRLPLIFVVVAALILIVPLALAAMPRPEPVSAAALRQVSATPAPTATAVTGVSVYLPLEAPPEFATALASIKSGVVRVDTDAAAQVIVKAEKGGPVQWLYVPVVPFPTTADALSMDAIRAYWRGDANALRGLSDTNTAPTFIVGTGTFPALRALLGEPALKIQQVDDSAVAGALWDARMAKTAAWSIVPFHLLDKREKALILDGQNVFSKQFAAAAYPLQQTFRLTGDADAVQTVSSALSAIPDFTFTNRDPARLTVIAMTGVTALTRATAYNMEISGINTPARDVGPFLIDSDLVHTSNEVAFAENCPYPNPIGGTMFCSNDKYMELLKTIHLELVELTGNHVNDYGREALSHSLDLYDAAGMLTTGGGRDLAHALAPTLIIHNGNAFAFMGCNPVGPVYAWATADKPGSAPCDLPYLQDQIAQLKRSGFIVIMSVQFQEYYSYDPPADQEQFFQQLAEWGADLVMGTQAHQPQGFGFYKGTFIHYGIGNLFFDQMDSINTRQMFADRLVFYAGRQIGAQFFTGIMEDYSRPRAMTPNERTDFLKLIFRASGW